MTEKNDAEEGWENRSMETPGLDGNGNIDWQSLWLYNSASVSLQRRPIFTGDVFRDVPLIGEDRPATVAVLQHPCSLMDRNNELRPALLVARLVEQEEIAPSGWAGNFDIMPLLIDPAGPTRHQAIAFDQLGLAQSSELDLAKRIACMEVSGVTLLLQRWTNMNTRVVVPCWRFEQVIEAQFAEADGMEQWSVQRQQARIKHADAMKEATAFLDEKGIDTGRPRRELFKDPNYRKNMIRRMHTTAKEMSDRENSERARIKAERKAQAASLAATASEDLPVAVNHADSQTSEAEAPPASS